MVEKRAVPLRDGEARKAVAHVVGAQGLDCEPVLLRARQHAADDGAALGSGLEQTRFGVERFAGAPLELPMRIWFLAGNFVSAWFVFLAGALLCAAGAFAPWLQVRSAG